MSADNKIYLSCIIPVLNEKENIRPLISDIVSSIGNLKISYEVIFVDDGSTDDTFAELIRIRNKYPRIVRIIKFRTNFGKSAAYDAGFRVSRGEFIATLDGDGQDDPHEVEKMMIKLKQGYDMVGGWRKYRKDRVAKTAASRIFNYVTFLFSSVKLHDFNCGMKIYRRKAVSSLHLYGDLHRYIPVLLAANGYKVTEIEVKHRTRYSGKSKYGSLRFINGFLDLFTIISISRFRSKPMHFFGYIGSVFFGFGFFIGAYLVSIKYILGQSIGDRPLLLLSIMLMIMGVEITVTGLVGEYIKMTVNPDRPSYDVEETAGFDIIT